MTHHSDSSAVLDEVIRLCYFIYHSSNLVFTLFFELIINVADCVEHFASVWNGIRIEDTQPVSIIVDDTW